MNLLGEVKITSIVLSISFKSSGKFDAKSIRSIIPTDESNLLSEAKTSNAYDCDADN